MRVHVIAVPYDSGNYNLRMGAGPERFLHSGVDSRLRDCGYDVYIDCIEASGSFRAEIKTSFELYGKLAERVSLAYHSDIFPLVLSENCGSCLGTVAGIDPIQLGIIWFDSHGDLNIPETTESDFWTGWDWQQRPVFAGGRW